MNVMTPAATGLVGFTLHTPNSVTIPGPWGELASIWEPAAYAEAILEQHAT
jgi:hypothetical protein